MLFICKWKKINPFLLSSLFFFDQFERGWDSLGASTDKTYFHADHPFKIPRSTGERCHADVWVNRLPFPPKTKNGIDISQPTPWMSLSFPSFSLDLFIQLAFATWKHALFSSSNTFYDIFARACEFFPQTSEHFHPHSTLKLTQSLWSTELKADSFPVFFIQHKVSLGPLSSFVVCDIKTSGTSRELQGK